ncbi:MAG: MarR family transcriptional regulator [Clostridia bacterium]|nr:MarR family transcriptional regulator [Clostridia bacterium]
MPDYSGALNDVLVKLFNRILSIEERVINQAYAGGLTITEIHVLEAVGADRWRSMSEIAARLGITLGTLTTSMNRLERKGYVTRVRPDQDRRVVLVGLTPNGLDAYRFHEVFHSEMVAAILHDLSPDDQVATLGAAQKLYEFFLKVEPCDIVR